MKDIESLEDIVVLVDTFYAKVQQNGLLAPVFDAFVAGNWDEHHDKLYRFWQSVLLKEMTYSGKPHKHHEKMEVSRQHFDKWLEIWTQNVDEHFAGPTADRAKYRGATMADNLFRKMETRK